jgi:hypothetical protein
VFCKPPFPCPFCCRWPTRNGTLSAHERAQTSGIRACARRSFAWG